MGKIDRKQFFKICLMLAISRSSPLFAGSHKDKSPQKTNRFPITVSVLKTGYMVELLAHLHYIGYARKALSENYSNIAYLFTSFSVSERIHADNYKKLLTQLGSSIKPLKKDILIFKTQKNLRTAAGKELAKIRETYPNLIKRLNTESHEQAVVYCMYSWKSHRQHEKQIKKIQKYAGLFFESVAKKIEGWEHDYYVCNNCGSTISDPPATPCEICNLPASRYKKIERPT